MEEFQSNTRKEVPIDERDGYAASAAELMRDVAAFERAMVAAVEAWPNSTAAAMTTPSLSYQAWIGHAGCAYTLGSPEHLTRQGWRTLSETEQAAANEAADRAIQHWRDNYAEA